MAWSWSHTAEAYGNAEANCAELPAETLREIEAEWRAYRPEASELENFHLGTFQDAMADLANVPADALAQSVWERASDERTCDNGGWNAWLCPFGCDPHKVSFDREER